MAYLVRRQPQTMKNAFLWLLLFVLFAGIAGKRNDVIHGTITRNIVEEKTCVCNVSGTHRNSLGALIYNERCDCKCKKHVTGKECNICKDGFYNLQSGHGCLPCLCDDVGSRNKLCEKTSGECPCLDGFLGYRCNNCQPDHYRKSSNECAKCNCNIYGSKDLQCDNTGHCPCHENVTGKKCDSCKEFTHDLTKRCVACPECYRDVNITIEGLKNSLSEAHELIYNSLNDVDKDTNEQFAKTLQDFIEKTNKLELSLRNLPMIDMTAAQDLSKKAHELHKEVKKHLVDSKTKQGKLNNNLKNAVSSQVAFKKNMGSLIVDFEKFFAQASNVSANITNEDDQMKNSANQSRIILDEIANDVNRMNSVADETQTACTKTCDSARSFDENRKKMGNKLDALKRSQTRNRVNKLTDEINEVKLLAEQYGEANSKNKKKMEGLTWPPKMKNIDEELASSNDRKVKEVSGYIDGFGKLLVDSEKTLVKCEELKENSTNVLNEMNELDRIVSNDVDRIDDFFDNFQNINTLNETLQKDKASFKEKWKQYPYLRKMVDSIQNDTKTLRQEVDNIKRCVEEFTKHAAKQLNEIQNIQKSIQNHFSVLEQMENKLSSTVERITNESQHVTENTKIVEELLKRAEQQEQQLEQQRKQLKSIRENDVMKEFEKSEKKINDTIQRAKDVIAFLDVLPTEDDELAEIEKEMDFAEEIIRLKDEIEFLKNEVKNVEEIRDSLNSIDIKRNLCMVTTIEQKGSSP